MTFFKRVLSTIVGIFIFILLCFLFIMVIGAAFGSSSKDQVIVKNNTILELKLDFPIQDYAAKTKIKDFPMLNDNQEIGLLSIINAINYAAEDDKIKGISIDNNFIDAGISQTKAIRDALLEFKKSGKFITSYADIYTQKDYYLNSVADSIYLNPAGVLEFKGLSTERLYFKDFQEKTGVKMEVIRLGKYKSAVEPYLENEMSEANREQIKVYLNGLWNVMTQEISESRNTTVANLNTIADNLDTRNANKAIASKLIDKVAYYDQYVNDLAALTNTDADDLEKISIKKYSSTVSKKRILNKSKNKIAIIYAEGEIIYGEGDEDFVGQGTINKALKKAREDDKIKSIVLRINSPGGSALASELIWREIELTKAVKPVIVSMGNLAASGGYYIACNANKIIAEPTTITGSIGVFGVLPNINKLANTMGINAQQVKTNKNTIMYSPFQPLDETQRTFIKESVSDIYELFTTRVANGRGMTQTAVKAIGQGRVWTGTDALKNGLVDELGGLDLAIKYAAEVAKIEDYKIREYPVFETNLEDMLSKFGLVKAKEVILKEELGEANYKLLKQIKSQTQKKGIQLLFPFSTEIN